MRSALGRLVLWTAEALDRILLTVPDLDLDDSYSPSRSARTAVTDGAAWCLLVATEFGRAGSVSHWRLSSAVPAHKLTELSEQVPTPARSGVRARLLGWLAHLL